VKGICPVHAEPIHFIGKNSLKTTMMEKQVLVFPKSHKKIMFCGKNLKGT
jgi:hypothetical protein